ncbi:MAG: hypothetical protein EB127_14595 [Alphaproteobacteria bacterium]|nr:hypothetical protein [Alphaproteobacteria bacterium]
MDSLQLYKLDKSNIQLNLQDIMSLTEVCHIQLSIQITYNTVFFFENLHNNKKIKTLNLSCNAIFRNIEAVQALTQALERSDNISTLDLSCSIIEDKGLRVINNYLHKTKITSIFLRCNNLTERSYPFVKLLIDQNPNLTLMDLSYNNALCQMMFATLATKDFTKDFMYKINIRIDLAFMGYKSIGPDHSTKFDCNYYISQLSNNHEVSIISSKEEFGICKYSLSLGARKQICSSISSFFFQEDKLQDEESREIHDIIKHSTIDYAPYTSESNEDFSFFGSDDI